MHAVALTFAMIMGFFLVLTAITFILTIFFLMATTAMWLAAGREMYWREAGPTDIAKVTCWFAVLSLACTAVMGAIAHILGAWS